MRISKVDAAIIQLHRAITLFRDEGDIVCSITLAGAAEEILGLLLRRKKSYPSATDQLRAMLKQWNPTLSNRTIDEEIHGVRNALKHARHAQETHVSTDQYDAAEIIMRACLNYLALERRYTPEMADFSVWFGKEYEPQGK